MVRELQNRSEATVGPGVAVVQQQQDVGAEADLGVGVLAISVEQGGPLFRGQLTLRVMGVPG